MTRRFKTYRTHHRRRRKERTDYRQRLGLLKSGKTRLVIRKAANNLVCQIVKHDSKGDRTVVTVTGKELRKAGWKSHCGNIPASYLIGLLCGVEAKKRKVTEAVFDIGLQASTGGSRLYAALKGAIDGGINVPYSKDILPDDKRISGAHIADYAKKLKSEKPQEYRKQFAKYVKDKIVPEDIAKQFELVKKKTLKK